MTSFSLEKTLEYLKIQESLRSENLTECYLCKGIFLYVFLFLLFFSLSYLIAYDYLFKIHFRGIFLGIHRALGHLSTQRALERYSGT